MGTTSSVATTASSSTSAVRRQSEMRSATVLYDYTPSLDSPYPNQDQEITLKQGQAAVVVGRERSDGFCKVKVGGHRGWVPVAFLVIDNKDNKDNKEAAYMTSN